MDKIRNRQHQPFFMVQNKLIDDGHLSHMGASACAVYLCLLRHANTEHQCFPSYSKLEEETGLVRATVSKSLNTLIDLGYVRKLTLKRKQANIYEIMDFPVFTSSKNELVQKMNQSKKQTTTSSKNELPLVQKMNSKNTKGKRLKEKDTQGKSEDQNLPPAKQPNVSVHTSNNSPDELPSSKEAIARLGYRWDAFINHLVEESRDWTAYKSCVSDQARALKIKRVYLVNQFEKGNLSNLIDLFEENYSATAQKNAQQGESNGIIESLVTIAKRNPLEAQKQANELERSKGLPKNLYWNKVLIQL